MMTFHLRCPVCGETLDIPITVSETWGQVQLGDNGTAEVTIVSDEDPVGRHMRPHFEDGSYAEAMQKAGLR